MTIAYTPQTPDRAGQRNTGSGTPTGRDTTSGHGSSGAHNAVAIMCRIDPDVPSSLQYRDGLAAVRSLIGCTPQPGRHAAKCPYAEDAGHAAECVFDVRMHGAALVRTTGERVRS